MNLCKRLIGKYKFDVNKTDDKGLTALHFSIQCGNKKLVELFIGLTMDIQVVTDDGINYLHIAADYGHMELCKTLIDKHKFVVIHKTDNRGWTALHFSVHSNSYDLFKCFADMGTDIYLSTKDGKNCLHIAAAHGYLNLCKILIDRHNFDVQASDNNGFTALHFSIQHGDYESVKFFVDMGTDIYLETSCGKNCLHIAAGYGHFDLCKTFLSEYNFNINATDNNEWTALHFSPTSDNFTLFSYIFKQVGEIYCKTKEMMNALHLSAKHGHFDICKFVLEYFSEDYQNNNTKKQHVLNGESYKSQVFYKYRIIFLHAIDVNGNTYLHLAADGNHSEVCDLLLKYDTEISTLLDKKDETARDTANKKDCQNVLNVLKTQYDREGLFFIFLVILIKLFYFMN